MFMRNYIDGEINMKVNKFELPIASELMTEREKADWTTGSSGRISAACAIIYKNAVYQLDE